MLRRGLALGGGLVVLILIVLGVKGCLDARANRELSDYARNVTQIVDETGQTSKAFFGKLEEPGGLSVREFIAAIDAERSAMDNLVSRVDGLSAPGDMHSGQKALELVYELRGSAMTQISNRMSTALGEAGAQQAIGAITRQMENLLAADVLYEQVARPEIDAVLHANGITDSDVPKNKYLPDGIKWLEESTVSAALGTVSGATEASTGGTHGLGLAGVSVNGTELAEGAPAVVSAEEAVEVEVQVENQGESTESGVSVSISVDGSNTLEDSIETLAVGETGSVTIPLTPTPKGTVTIEVKVATVPGEQISENNEASYSVTIE